MIAVFPDLEDTVAMVMLCRPSEPMEIPFPPAFRLGIYQIDDPFGGEFLKIPQEIRELACFRLHHQMKVITHDYIGVENHSLGSYTEP